MPIQFEVVLTIGVVTNMDKDKLSKKLNKFKDVLSEKDHKPPVWQQECQKYKQQQCEQQAQENATAEQKTEELSGYMNELTSDDEAFKALNITYNKLLQKHTQLQDDHIRLQREHIALQDEYRAYLKGENTNFKK